MGAHKKATTKDVMAHFDVKAPAVTRWTQAGCPYTKRKGIKYFDMAEVSAWVRKTGRLLTRDGGDTTSFAAKLRREGKEPTPTLQLEEEHKRAKLRKDLAAAERAEMELERVKGTLLDAEEVAQGRLDRVAKARAVLLGGPASVAPDIVGLDLQGVERELKAWVHRALEELRKE